MPLVKYFFLIILFIFYSSNATANEEQRIFDFERSSCSNEKNFDKVFKTEGSQLIFTFNNKIDKSNSKRFPAEFTKNKFKGKVDGYGNIKLKGKNGELIGRYNEAMNAKNILLKFNNSKSKYKNLNNCTLLFFGKYGDQVVSNSQQEKIIKTISRRLAKKIQRETKADLT